MTISAARLLGTKSVLPGFYTLSTEVPTREVETYTFHNSFMVKRGIFEGLDGFDCKNFPIRFSEVDFAYRLHAKGYLAKSKS